MFLMGINSEYFLENINKLNDPLILNISNIFNSKGWKTVEKLVLLFITFFLNMNFFEKTIIPVAKKFL